MSTERRFSSIAVLIAVTAAVCSAQSITSARSGTLHYFEGDVSIDGTTLVAKASKFPEIKEQGVLKTGKGRAEILLTPGVFLRVGENSSIRMLDTRLVSTRVDLLTGDAVVESDDPQMSMKDSPVTLLYKDYEIHLVKHGLIEITSNPSQMRVFKGEAEVSAGDNKVVVKEGRLMPFTAGLVTEKFTPKEGDDLYLWARDRSENLSAANMSSARSISQGSCYVACANGGGAWNGGWYYNPYFDMITYVPGGGVFWNPFGYGFFSPLTIGDYYYPTGYWYGGGGARSANLAGRSLASTGTRTGISGGGQPRGNIGTFGGGGNGLGASTGPAAGGIAGGGGGGFSGGSGGSGGGLSGGSGGGLSGGSAGGARGARGR
ncbi:MAG TPA: hypothetical protein VG273_03870 [Bryobacteraceae bacterium]|jgi:hypothetical protein|nr:hypothetical protein [Bryobacteraceae bacterium]